MNCGGIIGYAEDILYYVSRYFYQGGRSHDAFKDQRFWTDIFLSQARLGKPLPSHSQSFHPFGPSWSLFGA